MTYGFTTVMDRRGKDALAVDVIPFPDGKELQAFVQFYTSKDNGISWEAVKKNLAFPNEFKTIYEQAEGNYSCVVDNNNFIWIMWSKTGEVWRGRINKLGFIKQ